MLNVSRGLDEPIAAARRAERIRADATCGRKDGTLQQRQEAIVDWLPSTIAVHRDSAAMDVAAPQSRGPNPVQDSGFTAMISIRRFMMGQPSVQISWVINRSPQDVYEFFSNMENSPQWGRTSRTTKVSKGPIAVGTIFNEETQLMGQTLTIRTEVVEYNPPSQFSYTGVFSNGMRERANLTFEPVDGGTRVTLAGETEMGKVASLFSPFFSWMMKRQMTALSKNLKEVLERQ